MTSDTTALTRTPKAPRALSVEQQAMVYGHLEEGRLSQSQIAALVGVTRQTVHYYANRLKLSPKWILRSQGVNLTHSWLRAVPEAEKRGDIRPMERALLYGGHLMPLSGSEQDKVVVQLGVMLNIETPGNVPTLQVQARASAQPGEEAE